MWTLSCLRHIYTFCCIVTCKAPNHRTTCFFIKSCAPWNRSECLPTLFCRHMREVVGQCLQKEPERRPSAAQLLQHKFFTKHAKDKAFLVKALKLSSPGKDFVPTVLTPLIRSPSARIFASALLANPLRLRFLREGACLNMDTSTYALIIGRGPAVAVPQTPPQRADRGLAREALSPEVAAAFAGGAARQQAQQSRRAPQLGNGAMHGAEKRCVHERASCKQAADAHGDQ